MSATALLPAFCFENRDTCVQRFSAISVLDCKSVFGFVTKPGAPTGIDDKRCAIDMAVIRGCLRRMAVTLRWGPTGVTLGDAATTDKAESADLFRACVRASAHQLADESSTLQRAREREALSLAKVNGKIRGLGRRTSDENVLGRTGRCGTARILNDSNRRSHAGELSSQDRVDQLFVDTRESKGDALRNLNTIGYRAQSKLLCPFLFEFC